MQIERVPPHQVVAVWSKVEAFLAAAMSHSVGEYDLQQLRAFLTCGAQMLVVFTEDGEVRGAMTIAGESYPNMSVAFATAVGGNWFVTKSNADALYAWLRAQGFTHLRGFTHERALPVFERVGFNEIYRTIEVKL